MEDFDQLFDDHLFEIDKAEEKTIKLKEGERRMVSILFADIKGFTALSEKLDHEEVQSLMDQLMKIFSHSVDIHGGYVDKYTGDQIMALFGAKQASEVDTQRSINTGIDMLLKLKKFNSILKNSPKYSSLNIDFSIRVGINTGMVTTGAIGKEREGDYTVYGDSVNLAARMESNAPTDTIMIPEETMMLVNNYFDFIDHGSIEVKGKSKPISVYLVKSKKDIEIDRSTPFIGRENEINKMNNVYNTSLKKLNNESFNKIEMISCVADAGVGKSRLIHEFLNSKASKDIGNFFSIGHASNISSQPYYLFATLIKDIFKISEVDSADISKKKINTKIKEIEKFTKISLSDCLPFIGFLIGVKYKDDRLNDRQEIQNNINISVRTLMESICQFTNQQDKPYIFILDDFHWIDKMSLDLLVFLFSTFDFKNKNKNKNMSYPLFLTTFRSHYEIPQNLLNEIDYTQLDLKPLTKDHSIDLINYLTRKIQITKVKKMELYDKSRGNPFFIEEWVNLINEKRSYSEVLEESQGIGEYSIPNSINALILARVDRLDKNLKSLLQKATIIGEDFFLQILSKLEQKLGFDNDVEKPINDLEKENFIHHFINQLDHYKFKHILTRDVAYSTILKSNKKILHKSVAEVIEENFNDKIEIFYFDLALHYDISENSEKAITYLMLAGIKNYFIFDYTQSKLCFERIIKIIENDTDLNNANESIINDYYKSKLYLAKISLSTGEWNESLEILKSIKCKDEKLNKTLLYDIHYTFGEVYLMKREHEIAILNFKKALHISEELNDKIKEGSTIGELAHIAFQLGQNDAALKGFNKELELFKASNSLLKLPIAYGHFGIFYLQNGKMDKALDFFNKKYKISSENDSKQQILMALGNISLIHNIRGEYDKSLKIFEEVLDISENINDLRNQSLTYGNKGIIYKNLKKYEESLENYFKQIEISTKMEDLFSKSNAYDGIGVVYLKIKKYKEAKDEILKAIEIKKKIKDQNGYASSLNNLAEAMIGLGEVSKSIDLLNKAIDIFKQLDNLRAMHICSSELAKAFMLNDDFKNSIPIFKESLDFFIEIKDFSSFIKYAPNLSKCYYNNKNYSKAIEVLNNSINYNKSSTIDIDIELAIINCMQTETSDMLKDILNMNITDEQCAYIHFNIGTILADKKELEISKKIFLKLFKKYNDFSYNYFIKKIK